jgi:hypothetical protein
MNSRFVVAVGLLLAVLSVGTVTRAGDVAGSRQWTIVNFADPVQVKDQILMGPVLIVHDDQKMSQGEPCTTFYRFQPGVGPKEALVSFHCKPIRRGAVAETTFTYADNAGGCKRLIEYQIGGDAEAHGVPRK